MPRINIETYRYRMDHGRYDTNNNCARIDLNDAKGRRARLYFNHDKAAANQAATMQGSELVAHFHMSYLDGMIDMLRNEDTCYCWHNVGADLVYLATGNEEMGEEES